MPADQNAGDTTPPERPLPSLAEPDTAPFWVATRDHRLTYQVCGSCGEVIFYPRRHCPSCLSVDTQWHDSAGDGTVYTFTVIRQHGQPYFRGRVPYVLGFIDLDEGFRLLAEIDADPAAVHVGQRVTAGWDDHAELAVPVFRPAVAGRAGDAGATASAPTRSAPAGRTRPESGTGRPPEAINPPGAGARRREPRV